MTKERNDDMYRESDTHMDNDGLVEGLDEPGDEAPVSDSRHQILKYGAVWLALMALFFVANTAIKSYTASQGQAVYQTGTSGYGVAGTPVADGYGQAGAAGGCGGECCSTGGGAGAGTSATGDFTQLEKAAVNWYVQNYGDGNVTAQVQDFGCHQEIGIVKDGKIVQQLEFRNGQFKPLTTPW